MRGFENEPQCAPLTFQGVPVKYRCQPAALRPNAVAGNGDAEKSARLQKWFQRTLDTLQDFNKSKLVPELKFQSKFSVFLFLW